MDADHIRSPQQRCQRCRSDAHRLLLGGAQGGILVVILQVDLKAPQPPRHFLRDVADAHQPHRLALQLVGVNAAVAGGPPAAPFHQRGVVIQPPIDGQHQHNGVFGHRHRIGAAVVGDRNAQIGGQLQVHPVVAGAQQLQQPHFGRAGQHPVGQPSGEQQEKIGILRQLNLGVLIQPAGGGDDIHPGGRFVDHNLAVVVVQVGQKNYFRFGHCNPLPDVLRLSTAPAGRTRRGSPRRARRSLCGRR